MTGPHPFDSDPTYESLGVPRREHRFQHPISGLLRDLAISVERLEAWRDRVRAWECVVGGLTPEEHAQDEALGREALGDVVAFATAIDAVVGEDLALLPTRKTS